MASIKERDRKISARFASPVNDIIPAESTFRGTSFSSGRNSRSISTGRNAIGASDRFSRRFSRYTSELEITEAQPLDRPRSGPLEAAFDLFESQDRRFRCRPSTSGEFGGARDSAHEISGAVGTNGGDTGKRDSLLHRRRLFRHNSAAFIRTPSRAVGFLAFQSSNGSSSPSPSPTGSAAALTAPSPTSRSRLLQRLRGKSDSPARESSARNPPVARNQNGAIPVSRSVDASPPFSAEQGSRSDITRVRSGRSGGRRMQAIMSVPNAVASSASDAGANVASIPGSGSSSESFPRVARVPSTRNVANVASVASVASIASLASLGSSSSEFSVSTIKRTCASDGSSVAFSRSSSNSSLTTSASVANYSSNAATSAISVATSLSLAATRSNQSSITADVTQSDAAKAGLTETGVSLRDVGRQQPMRGNEELQDRSEGNEKEQVGGGTAEESEWGDLEEFAEVECVNWRDISAVCQANDAAGIKLLFVDIQVADVTAGLPDVTQEQTQKQAGGAPAQQQGRPSRPRSQIQVSYHITFPDHSSPASTPPASATEASLSSAEAVSGSSSGDSCTSSSCSGGKIAARNVHTPAAAAAAASTNADPSTAPATVSSTAASTVPTAPPNHADPPRSTPPGSTLPSSTAPNSTLPRPLLPVKIAHLRNRHPHIDLPTLHSPSCSSPSQLHSPYRSPHMDSNSRTSRFESPSKVHSPSRFDSPSKFDSPSSRFDSPSSRFESPSKFDSPNRGQQSRTPSSTSVASSSKHRTHQSITASSSASASSSSSPSPSYSSSPSSIASPTAALMRFQSALFSNSPCSPLSSCWSSSSPVESPRNSPREYQESSPGECLENPGLSPATPGKIMGAYQRREKGEFDSDGCARRTPASGANSPALAAVACAAPTLAGPPSPLLAASVFNNGSPRASSPSKIRLSASGSGSSGGPVLAPSRFREGPRRADLDSPLAESPSVRAVAGSGLAETTDTTLEVLSCSEKPVDLSGEELGGHKEVVASRDEGLREGSTKVGPGNKWKRLVKAVMHRQVAAS